ncbi:two-component sensor histidine kinase [Acetobacter syzygii]|uniref:HAMP domain-containing sensor histidine kinase n=1 Tax=Acetobacter syzygii TaxID=146476 RepID=UPI0005E1C9C6|nr:HAMP domain-containing sensor histidine kinase [Acetobacter syzygii]GAN71665.1 two component sensor histidine kinase [Acetobacter syzygii]GBR62338.1 two component sensor histidine kinase [Acetobacter syzygii NRIC 0483]GEL56498.1 two-component sensor histidine kinase [Acetobacter syzygii]
MPTRLPGVRIQSVSLRFGIVYSVLFIISAILFLSFVWWGTIGLLDQRVRHSIAVDAHAMLTEWAHEGVPGLENLISNRLAQDIDDNAIYLLSAPDGRLLAGNLAHWPARVDHAMHWQTLPVLRDGQLNLAQTRVWMLDGNYRLLIGRDISARTQIQRMLTDAMLWTCLMVGLLAIGGGWVVRTLFRQIIHSINRTTLAITQGDMSRRIAVSGTGDELDDVALTINQMLDRISRLMDGVKQVSNSIAHDLRTPIARARAELEDASRHATSEQALRAAIDQAVVNLDNVTGICEALLRIAQIEAGTRRSAFATFDLASTLRDMAELYEAVAEEHELKLLTDLPEHLPFMGDQAMFQQALANILDNAIKFSPPHGSISLSAQKLPPAIPNDREWASTIRIKVIDCGIGMNSADLARASERFFRAERARNTPGSGLGLALVQAIVELHGGTLYLTHNTPGLVVTIDVPALHVLSDKT